MGELQSRFAQEKWLPQYGDAIAAAKERLALVMTPGIDRYFAFIRSGRDSYEYEH